MAGTRRGIPGPTASLRRDTADGDAAHLAEQPDLSEEDARVGQRRAAGRGEERADDGEVRRRLVHLDPARARDEDLARRRARRPRPRARRAAARAVRRRRRSRRGAASRRRTAPTSAWISTSSERDALAGGGHGAAGQARAPLGQQRRRRVGQLRQSLARHLVEGDLVDRPETVLRDPQQTPRRAAVALDRDDRVHEVLERLRPGERAVLRDVPDQQDRERRAAWRSASAPPAAARTCDTVPGAEERSGCWTAWMESTTRTAGGRASASARTRETSVSERTSRCSSRMPSRSPRSRTCCTDSSALAYRTSTPRACRARPRPACRRSVDFPMPGSPPSSTTEPGTSPPPSTRSSPGRPVERRGFSSRSPGGAWLMTSGTAAAAEPGAGRGAGRLRADLFDVGVPLPALGAAAQPLGRLGAAGLAGEDGGRSRHGSSGTSVSAPPPRRLRRGT